MEKSHKNNFLSNPKSEQEKGRKRERKREREKERKREREKERQREKCHQCTNWNDVMKGKEKSFY